MQYAHAFMCVSIYNKKEHLFDFQFFNNYRLKFYYFFNNFNTLIETIIALFRVRFFCDAERSAWSFEYSYVNAYIF